MVSFVVVFDSSIYTIYVNVHLFIEKFDGINYDTWTLYIKLWLKSQGYVDHLIKCGVDVDQNVILVD